MKKFIACCKLLYNVRGTTDGNNMMAHLFAAPLLMFLLYEVLTMGGGSSNYMHFALLPMIWIISGDMYFRSGPLDSMLPLTDRLRAAVELLDIPCRLFICCVCVVEVCGGFGIGRNEDLPTIGDLTYFFCLCSGVWFLMKMLRLLKQEKTRRLGLRAFYVLWTVLLVLIAKILERQGNPESFSFAFLSSLWGGWYLVLGSFVFCLITGLAAWKCYARPRVRDPKAPAWFPLEADEGDDRDEAELEAKRRAHRRRRIVVRSLIVLVIMFLIFRQA